jgi:hypothetical protein
MKTQRMGIGGGLSTYRHDLLAAMNPLLMAPLFGLCPPPVGYAGRRG